MLFANFHRFQLGGSTPEHRAWEAMAGLQQLRGGEEGECLPPGEEDDNVPLMQVEEREEVLEDGTIKKTRIVTSLNRELLESDAMFERKEAEGETE